MSRKSSTDSEKEWNRSVEDLNSSYPRAFYRKPYISVGIGWHSILHEVASSIETAISKKMLKDPSISINDTPYIWDIKEKYGTLRVSFTNVTDKFAEEVFSLEDMAEQLSVNTCEQCGNPGSQTKSSWIKTLCETCATHSGLSIK